MTDTLISSLFLLSRLPENQVKGLSQSRLDEARAVLSFERRWSVGKASVLFIDTTAITAGIRSA